jgi:hypothetical protein
LEVLAERVPKEQSAKQFVYHDFPATAKTRRRRTGSIPTLWPSCSPSTPRLPRCPQSVPRSVMGISRR